MKEQLVLQLKWEYLFYFKKTILFSKKSEIKDTF